MLVLVMAMGRRRSDAEGSSGHHDSDSNTIKLHCFINGRDVRYLVKEWRRVYRRLSEINISLDVKSVGTGDLLASKLRDIVVLASHPNS